MLENTDLEQLKIQYSKLFNLYQEVNQENRKLLAQIDTLLRESINNATKDNDNPWSNSTQYKYGDLVRYNDVPYYAHKYEKKDNDMIKWNPTIGISPDQDKAWQKWCMEQGQHDDTKISIRYMMAAERIKKVNTCKTCGGQYYSPFSPLDMMLGVI